MSFWTASHGNPGAEINSTQYWVSVLAGAPTVNGGSNSGSHTGSYYFDLGAGAYGAYFGDWVLDTEVLSKSFMGALSINPSVYQTDYTDNDTQRLKVIQIDVNSDPVSYWQDTLGTALNLTWTLNSLQLPLHPDARAVRWFVDGKRISGTEVSAYQDDYNLEANSFYFHYALPFINGFAPTTIDSWDVVSGELTTATASLAGYPNPTSGYFTGGNSAHLEAEQVITLADSFGLGTGIDDRAGIGDPVPLTLRYMQASLAGEGAFMKVSFQTSGGVDIEVNCTAWGSGATTWEQNSYSYDIPANTRMIKLSMVGSTATAPMDAYFDCIEASMTPRFNYVNGENDPFGTGVPAPTRGLRNHAQRSWPTTAMRAFPFIGVGPFYNGGDPYFSDVVLLINAEDQTAQDISTYGRVITETGVDINSSQSKFGQWSVHHDNFGDYLIMTNAPELDIGTRDFTMEHWIRWVVDPGAAVYVMSARYRNNTNDRMFYVQYAGTLGEDEKLRFILYDNGVNNPEILAGSWAGGIVTDVWYHVAAERYNNELTLYLDGNVVATQSVAPGYDVWTSDQWGYFGALYSNGTIQILEDCFVDEIRWTYGTARYQGSFTPPTKAFKTF